MEIHKPKPVHGWRELLNEIGVIVIGVLIALAAEQIVDELGWRQKVQEAEHAMRLELRDDDLPQAYVRASASACYAAQLDQIQTAIEADTPRPDIRALALRYRPPYRTWDSEAWRAAISSAAASHTSPERMLIWSGPYRLMPLMSEMNLNEVQHLIPLRAGRRAGGALSPAEAERMLLALETLRVDNLSIARGSMVLLHAAAAAGVEIPAAQEKALLAAVKGRLGGCVAKPDLGSFRESDPIQTFVEGS